MTTATTLDYTDTAILEERSRAYMARTGPQVGDYIDFQDCQRRVSHVWPADWHDDNVARVQTTDGQFGASFHLGKSGVSFSGGLYTGIKASLLTLSDELRDARFWFFHHDHMRAHNGVDVTFPVRVWKCSLTAKEAEGEAK